jgi:hypothetical protein
MSTHDQLAKRGSVQGKRDTLQLTWPQHASIVNCAGQRPEPFSARTVLVCASKNNAKQSPPVGCIKPFGLDMYTHSEDKVVY